MKNTKTTQFLIYTTDCISKIPLTFFVNSQPCYYTLN